MVYVSTKTCIEEFDSNKNNHFYVKKEDEKLGTYYVLAPTNSTDFNQTYYERKIERAYLSREDWYNKYTSFYSTQVPGYYVKITTTPFSATTTYYKEGYAAENYGYTAPDKTIWNQFDAGGNSLDPNLKNNEYYYVFLEQFIQANDAFDSTLTYYRNNAENESSARYITLSAAATTYPLSIGTSSSEYERKFKESKANSNLNHVKLYNDFVIDCPAEIQPEEPVPELQTSEYLSSVSTHSLKCSILLQIHHPFQQE